MSTVSVTEALFLVDAVHDAASLANVGHPHTWRELAPGARQRVRLGLAMLRGYLRETDHRHDGFYRAQSPSTPAEAEELVEQVEATARAQISDTSPTARHEREALGAAARIATYALRELAPAVPTTAPSTAAPGA